MSTITSNSEYWSGHTKVEVEEHIKSRLTAAQNGGHYFVVGTMGNQGSGTNTPRTSTKFNASISGITQPYDGMVIIYLVPSDFISTNLCTLGSGNSASYYVALSLDGTNYHQIFNHNGTYSYCGSSPRLQDIVAGKMMTLVYYSGKSGGVYNGSYSPTSVDGVWYMI